MKIYILLVAVLSLSSNVVKAQCYPDRHSTNFFDGWISCETAVNPNPLRPVSHFIMYDFRKVYKLGQMQFWNTNDPAHLDWGMRDVAIDYSIDGENWEYAGDFTFPQASGLSTYEGVTGPYLFEVEGRYLLITGLNNYGGECFGLSEMRITGEEVITTDVENIKDLGCVDITIYPNPFADKMTLSINPGCEGNISYILYDALAHAIASDHIQLKAGVDQSIEIGHNLPSGSYILFIESGGKSVQKNVIKLNRT
jgi:hypothetical protein